MSISASSPISLSRNLIYPYGYFAFLDAPDNVSNSKQEVRSIAEQVTPIVPDFKVDHPALEEMTLKRFVSQLMSHMDQYWDHFRDSALEKEIFFRLFKRDRNLRIEEMIQFQRLDILQAYILSLLFERQFLNALARQQSFLDRQKIKQWEAGVWRDLHRDEKLAASMEASRQWQKEFSHPYRFAIRRPNQIKMIDLLRYTTLQNQSLMWDSIALSMHQSRSLSQFFGKEWSAALMELQDALRRGQPGHVLSRLKWISDIFIHSWEHAWKFNTSFQEMVGEQLLLRAAYFPEFYSKDPLPDSPLFTQAIANEPVSIQQRLTDRPYWRQIVEATQQVDHTVKQAKNSERPFHWEDRVRSDPTMQPLLVEQLQREWNIDHNSGIHEAAVKNAQFETALANPYGFDSQRLNSRKNLMEEGLQSQKVAESMASEQLLRQQSSVAHHHEIHIAICKILAGIDYAASQNLRPRWDLSDELGSRSQPEEISRIDRVKKVAPS